MAKNSPNFEVEKFAKFPEFPRSVQNDSQSKFLQAVEEVSGASLVNGTQELRVNNMTESSNAFGYARGKTYPLQKLQSEADLPTDVDPTCKESYLTDEDFHRIFQMDKEAFQAIPQWRKIQLKKGAKLF